MRLIYYIFLIVIMATPALAAGPFGFGLGDKASQAAASKPKTARYQIIPDKEGNLSVKTGSKELKGKLLERKGIYSHWQFGDIDGQTAEDFEIIVNDKTKKLLNISVINGPSIIGTSPHNKYVILEEPNAPPWSPFEIRDSAGNKIFRDSYFYSPEPIWVNEEYIIYPSGEKDNKPTPAELKECQGTASGGNVVVFWVGYDLKTKKKTKLNLPIEKACG